MRTLEQAINTATPVEGERFDGDDLQEFHISEVEFRACRFVNCNFDFASFRAVRFIGCSFDHASFKEATFKDCIFAEGDTGSEWRYCDLSKAEFEKSNLSLNKFVGCQGYMLSFTDCAAPGLKVDIEAQRKVRSQVIPAGCASSAARCNMPNSRRATCRTAFSKAATCETPRSPAQS